MHEQYEAAFHHFKPDKRLRWLQHIGTAVVKLELEDRVVEVQATPLQASISELYEHQATWEVQAMSEKLGVDVAQVRNGLAFWANEGVVKEEDGGWRLLEIAEDQPAATSKSSLHSRSETLLIIQPLSRKNKSSKASIRARPKGSGSTGRYVSSIFRPPGSMIY